MDKEDFLYFGPFLVRILRALLLSRILKCSVVRFWCKLTEYIIDLLFSRTNKTGCTTVLLKSTKIRNFFSTLFQATSEWTRDTNSWPLLTCVERRRRLKKDGYFKRNLIVEHNSFVSGRSRVFGQRIQIRRADENYLAASYRFGFSTISRTRTTGPGSGCRIVRRTAIAERTFLCRCPSGKRGNCTGPVQTRSCRHYCSTVEIRRCRCEQKPHRRVDVVVHTAIMGQ